MIWKEWNENIPGLVKLGDSLSSVTLALFHRIFSGRCSDLKMTAKEEAAAL